MISGSEALREGNARFVAGTSTAASDVTPERIALLADGRAPFAIVLGCSDSRVPLEIVFDQGIGDLFVIRVAGNIVAPSQIGSVEFAAEQFGTPLVAVVGHTRCGAVNATLQALRAPDDDPGPNLRSIVTRVQPAVESVLRDPRASDPNWLEHAAVRANVRASVEGLRHGSEILEGRIDDGSLLVMAAEYDLASGVVEFFDLGEQASAA